MFWRESAGTPCAVRNLEHGFGPEVLHGVQRETIHVIELWVLCGLCVEGVYLCFHIGLFVKKRSKQGGYLGELPVKPRSPL
jgi:hypothetical protein